MTYSIQLQQDWNGAHAGDVVEVGKRDAHMLVNKGIGTRCMGAAPPPVIQTAAEAPVAAPTEEVEAVEPEATVEDEDEAVDGSFMVGVIDDEEAPDEEEANEDDEALDPEVADEESEESEDGAEEAPEASDDAEAVEAEEPATEEPVDETEADEDFSPETTEFGGELQTIGLDDVAEISAEDILGDMLKDEDNR